MRVGIATVHTPGIYGGAEFLVDGLVEAVRSAGHSIHKISVPFVFEPPEAAGGAMDQCLAVDFSRYGGGQIDLLVGLKFPAYLISHPDQRIWLLHQHRSAYELYDTAFGWQQGNPGTDALRSRIIAEDTKRLGGARAVYTISQRVSARLHQYCGVASQPLYHPPANAAEFRTEAALPYIFAPSRLEGLKRQELLLRALAVCTTPVQAILAGGGSQRAQLEHLAEQLDLGDRVRFLGPVSRAEMLTLYARATAVFFGPLDEDFGYVTLEAMLAGKPVITCTDSGGPLEFVVDGDTGLVCDPTAQAVAEALETLTNTPTRARQMGINGRQRYAAMDIGWDLVTEKLLANDLTAVAPGALAAG